MGAGVRAGGMQSCLMETDFNLERRRVLETDGGDVCAALWVCLMPLKNG